MEPSAALPETPAPAPHDAQSRRPRRGPVAVCLAALMGLILALLVVDSVLSVGSRLSEANAVLGAVFYCLMGALLGIGVIYPVVSVALRPVFSLSLLSEGAPPARRYWCRRTIAALVERGLMSPEESRALQGMVEDPNAIADALAVLFKEKTGPVVDAEIKRSAKVAFFSTALSQSPLVDVATMLSVNFNMVRSVVEACGYRPSAVALARIYIRVMANALVAGSMEEVDLEALLTGALGAGAAGHLSGVALASAAQGFANAFLTYRVGSIVKNCIYSQRAAIDMVGLRVRSYAEALGAMKSSGFVTEVAATVRSKAAGAADAVVENVKDAAQTVGKAAYRTAADAASAVSNAVTDNPVLRALKRTGRRDEGLLK